MNKNCNKTYVNSHLFILWCLRCFLVNVVHEGIPNILTISDYVITLLSVIWVLIIWSIITIPVVISIHVEMYFPLDVQHEYACDLC